MKTFQSPIHSIDVDCGLAIVAHEDNWDVTITFWRPRSFELQFSIPEKEALREWRNPFTSKTSAVLARLEMERVPRISSAHLIRRALDLALIRYIPDARGPIYLPSGVSSV